MNPKAQSFQDYLDKEKTERLHPGGNLREDLKTCGVPVPPGPEGGPAAGSGGLGPEHLRHGADPGGPEGPEKTNETALLKQIDETNRKYKAFKYYLDEEGNLVLDACILCRGQKVDGELVYILFNTLGQHLEEAYGQWMKVVWG